MRGPTVHCLASKLSCPKNGQLGPRLLILLHSQNPQARYIVAQPEPWTFLDLLHLPTGAHLVLNLLLEGPDHKDEVDSGQGDPWRHEADVPRSGAVDEAGIDQHVEDCGDQHDHTNDEDS